MTESGFVETNGARLYCEVDGSGPPLVLVHAGVANLRQWDPQVPAFAERYQVIRYDTRGWGRSESEPVEFANRDDLAAVLDHFGAASARLLGCSRSGSIALDFTVTNPKRVDALVFVAAGIGGYEPDLPDELVAPVIAFDNAVEEAVTAKEYVRAAEMETAYWVNGPNQPADRADPAVRALVYDWILSNYQAEKEAGIPQPLDPPAAERLDQLTMPVLAIVGELDEAPTNAYCEYLVGAAPNARLEVIPNAAHMMNMEHPELFTRIVLDFLAEVDRSS